MRSILKRLTGRKKNPTIADTEKDIADFIPKKKSEDLGSGSSSSRFFFVEELVKKILNNEFKTFNPKKIWEEKFNFIKHIHRLNGSYLEERGETFFDVEIDHNSTPAEKLLNRIGIILGGEGYSHEEKVEIQKKFVKAVEAVNRDKISDTRDALELITHGASQ